MPTSSLVLGHLSPCFPSPLWITWGGGGGGAKTGALVAFPLTCFGTTAALATTLGFSVVVQEKAPGLVCVIRPCLLLKLHCPREKDKAKKPETGGKTPVLDNFSRDLIKAAEEGKLDPIIGREQEINRIAQILSRRKKNNPIIIGEPGNGKKKEGTL